MLLNYEQLSMFLQFLKEYYPERNGHPSKYYDGDIGLFMKEFCEQHNLDIDIIFK